MSLWPLWFRSSMSGSRHLRSLFFDRCPLFYKKTEGGTTETQSPQRKLCAVCREHKNSAIVRFTLLDVHRLRKRDVPTDGVAIPRIKNEILERACLYIRGFAKPSVGITQIMSNDTRLRLAAKRIVSAVTRVNPIARRPTSSRRGGRRPRDAPGRTAFWLRG